MAGKNLGTIVLMGIGIAGASYLAKSENREKAMDIMHTMKSKIQSMLDGDQSDGMKELLEKAGHPDPHDLEDTRMVGEGSLYAVDYYNEVEQ